MSRTWSVTESGPLSGGMTAKLGEAPWANAPLLAIQGEGDPYGTMAQIDEIAASAPQTHLLKLPDCGHSPHKDQPEAVIEAIRAFLAEPKSIIN